MTTGLIKPNKTIDLTSGAFVAVKSPDYPIQGYYAWTTSGSGIYSSHNSNGDDLAYISSEVQPFPREIHVTATAANIEYVKSEAATDTLNIMFVPLEQPIY